MLQIDTGEPARLPAFLHLGFRPFFTGAMLFSVIAVVLWYFMQEIHETHSLSALRPCRAGPDRSRWAARASP